MKEMANVGVEQIFTSYDNPKGNAETERMMRTIKEEVIWQEEFQSLTEAKQKLEVWIRSYKREYVHSALGYKSPREFEESYYEGFQEAA